MLFGFRPRLARKAIEIGMNTLQYLTGLLLSELGDQPLLWGFVVFGVVTTISAIFTCMASGKYIGGYCARTIGITQRNIVLHRYDVPESSATPAVCTTAVKVVKAVLPIYRSHSIGQQTLTGKATMGNDLNVYFVFRAFSINNPFIRLRVTSATLSIFLWILPISRFGLLKHFCPIFLFPEVDPLSTFFFVVFSVLLYGLFTSLWVVFDITFFDVLSAPWIVFLPLPCILIVPLFVFAIILGFVCSETLPAPPGQRWRSIALFDRLKVFRGCRKFFTTLRVGAAFNRGIHSTSLLLSHVEGVVSGGVSCRFSVASLDTTRIIPQRGLAC